MHITGIMTLVISISLFLSPISIIAAMVVKQGGKVFIRDQTGYFGDVTLQTTWGSNRINSNTE